MKYTNYLILIYSLFYATTGFTSENFSSKTKCFKQTKKLLKLNKSRGIFNKMFHPTETVLRSPTKIFGKWVQFSVKDSKVQNFWVFEKSKRQKYSLGSNCKASLLKETDLKEEPYALKTFKDNDFKKIIKKGKGVIYIMNPSFRYSIKFLPEVAQFAKDKNLELTPLFASRSKFRKNISRTLASKNLTSEAFKINRSLEIKMRQLELHSPSYLFYKNGKIIKEHLIGVHTVSSLNKFYKKFVR